MISLIGHAGGRPDFRRGGNNGSSTAHSASVKSLATRNPSRLCCKRVATVHIVMVQQGFDNLLESHQTVVIQPSFRRRSQTASKASTAGSFAMRLDDINKLVGALRGVL